MSESGAHRADGSEGQVALAVRAPEHEAFQDADEVGVCWRHGTQRGVSLAMRLGRMLPARVFYSCNASRLDEVVELCRCAISVVAEGATQVGLVKVPQLDCR